MGERGVWLAVSKQAKEEKPTDFERITLEFNMVYNELLSHKRDNDTKLAQQRYLQLYNIYLKICNEGLAKTEQDIIDTKMSDASVLLDSKRKIVTLKQRDAEENKKV